MTAISTHTVFYTSLEPRPSHPDDMSQSGRKRLQVEILARKAGLEAGTKLGSWCKVISLVSSHFLKSCVEARE